MKKLNFDTYLYYDTDDNGNRVNMGKKPCFMTKGAACADVAIPANVTIKAGERKLIDLMLGFDIPEGYCIKMYPRSSLLVKYGLLSPVSIIDWDYKYAHVRWPVVNVSKDDVNLEAGTRVAQVYLCKQSEQGDWERKNVARDLGGFGGTGEK